MTKHEFGELLNMIISHRIHTIIEEKRELHRDHEKFKPLLAEQDRLNLLRHKSADW